MGQWAVLGFVRWGRELYYFHEELLSRPMTSQPALHGAIWGDDVRENILTRLRGEVVQPKRSASPRSQRKEVRQARKVRNDAARRSVLYPLIHLVLTWAVRRAEVISLRVKDWEPTTRTLTIRRSTTRRHIARAFVVDHETAALLNQVAAHRESEDWLFRTRRGGKWLCLHLSRQVRFLMKQIGMRGSLVECHAAAVRRLLRQHPRDPETVLAITGMSAMRYLRTYLERAQEHANSRQRSQRLYEDLMVAFHEVQGDFSSATLAELSEQEPVETMDLKGLVGGVVHSRGWRPG
jgi:integrase